MFEERTAQPDRAGGERDGEVALFETGADLRGGDRRRIPTLAAAESGWQRQRADR
jgi:hypothetical protein